MQRVYDVTMQRRSGYGAVFHVVARTAEEAIRKARKASIREYGVREGWRCKALSETGAVIL